MQAYLDWFPGDRAIQGIRNTLANRLLDIYERSQLRDMALVREEPVLFKRKAVPGAHPGGLAQQERRMVEAGIESLKWLVAEQHRDDEEDICSDRFQRVLREGKKRLASISSRSKPARRFPLVFEAYRLTGEAIWLEEAGRSSDWFLGKNDLQVPLYDAATGGCRDGLHPDRVNENQGAESTLSFLMALLEMQGVKRTSAAETASGNECSPLNPNNSSWLPNRQLRSNHRIRTRTQTSSVHALRRQSDTQPGAIGPIRSTASSTQGLCGCRGDTLLALPRGRPAWSVASLCGSIRKWNRRLAHRCEADICWPARASIPKRYGVSKTRASPTFRNSNNMPWHIPPSPAAVPEFHWHLQGLQELRAIRRHHAAGRQGCRALAAENRRLLGHDPSAGDDVWALTCGSPIRRICGTGVAIKSSSKRDAVDGGMPTRLAYVPRRLKLQRAGWRSITASDNTASGSIYRLGLALFDLEKAGDLSATGGLVDVWPGSCL